MDVNEPLKTFMQRRKKKKYKENNNENKIMRIENSPPPPPNNFSNGPSLDILIDPLSKEGGGGGY